MTSELILIARICEMSLKLHSVELMLCYCVTLRPFTNVNYLCLKPTNGGPRRVLFRTQPDVLFLTLPGDVGTSAQSQDEEDEEDVSPTLHQQDSRTPYGERNGLR